MTLAEYSRHRGVARSSVTAAVREGRISLVTGPKGKRGVDPDRADIQWAANTQATAVVKEVLGDKTLTEIRSEKEDVQVKLLQLKYDELSSELVKASDVEKEWANLAVKVKTKILSVASKMKQRFSDLSLEHYNYLDQLHREALEEIADGKD